MVASADSNGGDSERGHLGPGVTRSASRQADLFGHAVEDRAIHSRSGRLACGASDGRRQPTLPDPECAARLLDAHDDYRVLRRLKPRPIGSVYRPGTGEGLALLVDVETTGLDHRTHEVIEIGMVAFAYDAAGRIGDVVGVLGALQEPRAEISAEITRLTGITAETVKGQAIDISAVRAMVEPVDLVIAHNAKFDRAFCERLDEGFRHC